MRISNFSPSVLFDAAILRVIGLGGLEVGEGTVRNESGIFPTINCNCFLVSFSAALLCKRLFFGPEIIVVHELSLKKMWLKIWG